MFSITTYLIDYDLIMQSEAINKHGYQFIFSDYMPL